MSMKRSVHIQAELNELGAFMLNEIPVTMPYALPVDYFEVFEPELMHFTQIENEIEFITKLSNNKSVPFADPGADYFAGLSANILGKINNEQEWSKNNPYALPVGYFEQLPQQILAKAKQQKTVLAPKRIPLFRTVQLAASMALVVFIGLGILQINQRSGSKNVSLMGITDSEIAAYVDANIDDFDTDLILNGMSQADFKAESAKVSNEEIKDYMNEEGLN